MVFRVQRLALLACLTLATGCAGDRELRVGGGARGFFSYTRDAHRHSDSIYGDDTPEYNLTNLRVRAFAAEATLGVSDFELVASVEWTHVEDEYFRTALCGVRVRLRDTEDDSGIYVELLGRSVLDAEGGHTLFDGFQFGGGVLSRLAPGLLLDCGTHWVYLKPDAIHPDSDAVSQVWVGVGIRFGF